MRENLDGQCKYNKVIAETVVSIKQKELLIFSLIMVKRYIDATNMSRSRGYFWILIISILSKILLNCSDFCPRRQLIKSMVISTRIRIERDLAILISVIFSHYCHKLKPNIFPLQINWTLIGYQTKQNIWLRLYEFQK